jgi:AraC family transcriptional regulator, positive regulator of tynA and feaB
VFNDGERTIARYIRDRRLDAIALELRTAARRAELSELAAHHGYRGHEAMSRAFRERFGVSPTEYRAREYRALG